MFTQSVLLTELDKTTQRVEALIRQLKSVYEAYQLSQTQLLAMTQAKEQLEEELITCQELMAAQQQEVGQAHIEMAELRARHEFELEKRKVSDQTERDSLRSRLEAERDEVRSSLQNRLDEQRLQFERESAETVRQKEGEIESLRDQLSSAQEAHQLRLKQANDRIHQVEHQNEELQQYVDGMRTQVEFVRDQVVRILDNLPQAS